MAQTKITAAEISLTIIGSVYNSANGTLAASGDTKITFNTKTFDIGNNFSLVNSRFIAPVAGYYQFDATVFVSAASSVHNAQFRKNGVLIYIGTEFTGNGTTGYIASTPLQLAAGDYVEVWAYNNTTAKTWMGSDIRTRFSWQMISQI